ncbi:MAG: hypothetical protein AAF950_01760 [Pseudomonadota bacterium]
MSDIPMILERVGKKLIVDVAPHFDGHYAAGHTTLAGLLAVMASEAFDGMVDRMFSEISDMRTLLADGGKDPGDTRGLSMKVSALQVVHNRLSAELIALQEEIEVKSDDASKALNARIWTFFVEGAEARMPTLPDFAEAREATLAKLQADAE